MGIVTGIVVYVILWWLVFFMVLPFGVQRNETPEEGHDPGAPKRALIGRKMLITTAVAAALFAVYWAVVECR
jgi:predicted secreted protein